MSYLSLFFAFSSAIAFDVALQFFERPFQVSDYHCYYLQRTISFLDIHGGSNQIGIFIVSSPKNKQTPNRFAVCEN